MMKTKSDFQTIIRTGNDVGTVVFVGVRCPQCKHEFALTLSYLECPQCGYQYISEQLRQEAKEALEQFPDIEEDMDPNDVVRATIVWLNEHIYVIREGLERIAKS